MVQWDLGRSACWQELVRTQAMSDLLDIALVVVPVVMAALWLYIVALCIMAAAE